MTSSTALSIRDLCKTYRNGFEALKGISFDVQENDFFALLGPNGAGKSTTIGIITSLVKKNSGTVHIFDHNIDVDFQVAKKDIGIVPQEFNCSIFEKPLDILIHQAGYYGIPYKIARVRGEHYLKKLELWNKRDVQTRELSGGMKRRLMIARALVHEPKLLILDEPTAGVDIEIRRSMWQFLIDINQAGTTIILTTHYLEEAEQLCKNIAIINQGNIIENTSMQKLLQKLSLETFVLTLAKPLKRTPDLFDFSCHLRDPYTLMVEVAQQQDMNHLFEQLSNHGIVINTLRNKANRLEELFLSMVTLHKEERRT